MKRNTVIALDARSIFRPVRRGTAKNLIDVYRRVAKLRPDWQILMFHQIPAEDNPFADCDNVSLHQIDIKGDRFSFWQHIRLPLAAKASGVDVLHCPANTSPCYPIVPVVLTVHDLIPLENDFSSARTKSWLRNIKRSVHQARRIVTPSTYTRKLIIERLGVDEDKITVNPWAADGACTLVSQDGELTRVREKYTSFPDRKYVLGFGAVDPRKNTERVIRAWSMLSEDIRQQYSLVMVGIDESVRSRFQTIAARVGLNGDCRLHGFVEEEDIPALLSGATMLCYPSLSEGFGLPILDAFACETPVLTSSTTSLPEVAGEAAMLVDPHDHNDIARGMKSILLDEQRRIDMVHAGKQRLKQFTWESCANRLCTVLECVLEG